MTPTDPADLPEANLPESEPSPPTPRRSHARSGTAKNGAGATLPEPGAATNTAAEAAPAPAVTPVASPPGAPVVPLLAVPTAPQTKTTPARAAAAPLRVLAVASEIFPLIKTGGLADVVGGLPFALAHHGIAVRTLVPGYPEVLRALQDTKVVAEYGFFFGGPAKLLSGNAAGLELYVLESPQMFWRDGNPYLGPDGKEWPDNALRFAALAHMGYLLARGDFAEPPDVVHAHDWQAALTPAYLHYGGVSRPKSVLTIHNLAFQGHYPRELLYAIGLPGDAYAIDGVEYFGGIGYLKAGIRFADRVTTVSPRYAAEICRPEAGMGLEGLLRQKGRDLVGIVNGIDVDTWNPATDPALVTTYDVDHLDARAANKAELERRFGLTPSEGPIIAIVSRLAWQKGIDLVIEALPTILGSGCRLVALGTGEAKLEKAFAEAVVEYPGRVGVFAGYDETLAHLVQGGADAILVPSRFEPCGLTQLYGMRYGNLPIVSAVGGLADTVIDANDTAIELGAATGIVFSPVTLDALEEAIRRFAALHADKPLWRAMQKRAMTIDLSWSRRAGVYAEMFRSLVEAGSA